MYLFIYLSIPLQIQAYFAAQKNVTFLTEKVIIARADPSSTLNTRDEFVSKCRRMNKSILKCFKK